MIVLCQSRGSVKWSSSLWKEELSEYQTARWRDRCSLEINSSLRTVPDIAEIHEDMVEILPRIYSWQNILSTSDPLSLSFPSENPLSASPNTLRPMSTSELPLRDESAIQFPRENGSWSWGIVLFRLCTWSMFIRALKEGESFPKAILKCHVHIREDERSEQKCCTLQYKRLTFSK